MTPFNKPYLTGKEAHYIFQAVYDLGWFREIVFMAKSF